MNAERVKLVIGIFLLSMAPLLVVAGVAGLGAAYRWALRTRAVDAALLDGAGLSPTAVAERSRWSADDPGPRALEPFVRDRVAADLLAAWSEIAYARRSGDGSGLSGSLRGPALDDARRALALSGPARLTEGVHTLTARFYAPDGATVVLEDAHCYRQEPLDGGAPLGGERRVEVVLVASEGRWRVRDWRVLADAPTIDACAAG